MGGKEASKQELSKGDQNQWSWDKDPQQVNRALIFTPVQTFYNIIFH